MWCWVFAHSHWYAHNCPRINCIILVVRQTCICRRRTEANTNKTTHTQYKLVNTFTFCTAPPPIFELLNPLIWKWNDSIREKKNDLFRYTTKSSIVWISIIVVFISNDFSHIDPTEHYPKMTENKTAVDCIFYYCLFFRLHDWNELAWRVRETNRGNWRMWWQPHSILSGRKVPYILSSLSITRTAEKSIPIYASLRAHEHIAWALLNTELVFVSSTRQNHVLRGCTTERDAPSSAGHRCHMEYSDC